MKVWIPHTPDFCPICGADDTIPLYPQGDELPASTVHRCPECEQVFQVRTVQDLPDVVTPKE